MRTFSSTDKKRKKYIKPFKCEYFYWGHSHRDKGDKFGFCEDLAEAYGNVSRHLGRGSVYWRARITDVENEKIILIATRQRTGIEYKEF
jgi:hypothetical protein